MHSALVFRPGLGAMMKPATRYPTLDYSAFIYFQITLMNGYNTLKSKLYSNMQISLHWYCLNNQPRAEIRDYLFLKGT